MSLYDLVYDAENSMYTYRDCSYEICHSIGFCESESYAYTFTVYKVTLSDGTYIECDTQQEVFDKIDASWGTYEN